MDWRTVTFVFLPHQLREFTALLDMLPSSDLVGVADVESFDPFVSAAQRFGRLKDIRSIGLIVAELTSLALAELEAAQDDAEGEDEAAD